MFRQGCANKVFGWENSVELRIPEPGWGGRLFKEWSTGFRRPDARINVKLLPPQMKLFLGSTHEEHHSLKHYGMGFQLNYIQILDGHGLLCSLGDTRLTARTTLLSSTLVAPHSVRTARARFAVCSLER